MVCSDMIFPYTAETNSTEETELAGRLLARAISTDTSLPRFIAMYGDLGVGKTAFVRGFASELAPDVSVKSPTFALVNEYKCSAQGIKKICHFDMYRISGEDDLYSIGFYDYLSPDTLCIAEWCEMIPFALPRKYISVKIQKIDFDCKRKIEISISN